MAVRDAWRAGVWCGLYSVAVRCAVYPAQKGGGGRPFDRATAVGSSIALQVLTSASGLDHNDRDIVDWSHELLASSRVQSDKLCQWLKRH